MVKVGIFLIFCSLFWPGNSSFASGPVYILRGDEPSMMLTSKHFAPLDIIFGPRTQGNRVPWWGRKYDSITSQHMYMQSDIGVGGNITSFAWQNYPLEDMEGIYNNVRIYMGHTSRTILVSTLADNYTDPRTLVFSRPTFTTGGPVDTWNDILLDTPFRYNNTDNLIIEVRWNGDDDRSVLVWCGYWTGHGGRTYAFTDTATTGSIDHDYVYYIKLHIEEIIQPTHTPSVTPTNSPVVTPLVTPTGTPLPTVNPPGFLILIAVVIPIFLMKLSVRK